MSELAQLVPLLPCHVKVNLRMCSTQMQTYQEPLMKNTIDCCPTCPANITLEGLGGPLESNHSWQSLNESMVAGLCPHQQSQHFPTEVC